MLLPTLRKGKLTAKFQSLKRVHNDDTKGFMSPETFRDVRETGCWLHQKVTIKLLFFPYFVTWGPFLESPETIRWHNSLWEYYVNCGHTNEMKMWSTQLWLRFKQSQIKPEKCFRCFNVLVFIAQSDFCEWLFGLVKFSGLLRNTPDPQSFLARLLMPKMVDDLYLCQEALEICVLFPPPWMTSRKILGVSSE